MPTTTYDRSPLTLDFEMVDLRDVMVVDIVVDETNKLWVNVNGKCLLRVGKALNLTLSIKGKINPT